jgi:hypothetical protein
MLMMTPEKEELFLNCIHPDSGKELVITHRTRYDSATQIRHHQLFRREGDGPVEPDGELTMRMFFPQELDALFWYNGFAIDRKYGGFDQQPFDERSTMQQYILKRR